MLSQDISRTHCQTVKKMCISGKWTLCVPGSVAAREVWWVGVIKRNLVKGGGAGVGGGDKVSFLTKEYFEIKI